MLIAAGAGAAPALLYQVPSTNSGYDGTRLVRLDPVTGAIAVSAEIGSNWSGAGGLDAFDHDGQLTKRDMRASALARLAPAPGQTLWDVGAGAGSIGIEWMRAHPTCRAIAVEAREDRAKRAAENAVRLGVGSLRVVIGHAPRHLDRNITLAGRVIQGMELLKGGVMRLRRCRGVPIRLDGLLPQP